MVHQSPATRPAVPSRKVPSQKLPKGIQQTVGRDEELRQLKNNLSKGIDTLLLGPIGVGKSHLLALLNAENMFVVKTLSPAKESLINIAEDLHKTGRLCPDGPDFETIKKQHTRTTIQGWTDMVLGSVKKNEFVLIVDDLSDMTASVGRLIDKLNRKFIIIAALPEVRKPYEKHFWKFDRIEIERLSTADAKKLIRQCTAGANIEDYRMTETNILQQSAGNPRAIIEIVERFRKEPAVTRSVVRDVLHTGARNQIDLTFAVVLLLLAVVAARFFMRGIGSMEGYVLAGIGSALLVGIRFFMYRFNRDCTDSHCIWTAHCVVGISPIIDPENGTCKVTGLFLNAGKYVRPGALVNVTIGR